MNKCCVCGKEFESNEPSVLFINEAGKDEIICDECIAQTEKMAESENINEKFAAAEYLRKCAASCESAEVSRYLKDALSFNGFKPEEKKPSIWISGSRIAGAAIFIISLLSALMLRSAGKIDVVVFLIIAVSSVIAFVFMMMLCEAAQNIAEIKDTLAKGNKIDKL